MEIALGQWAELRFSGEVFEMEDQRNWTDASFKIFGTPLHLPWPVEVKAGTHIAQTLTLALQPIPPMSVVPMAERQRAIGLTLGAQRQPLPSLGLGVASHGAPLTAREAARLRALKLAHLRLDLSPGEADLAPRLQQASEEARQLEAGLEVALHIPEDGEAALESFAALVARVQPPIVRWLVYPTGGNYGGEPPTRKALALARAHLGNILPGVPIAGGTNTDFILLSRIPLPAAEIDELCLAMHPQAHAFDNASLVETLAAQAEVVANAHALAEGRPIVVSPVTFKPRFIPHDDGPAPATQTGDLPPEVDVRQMSLFGAGWTAGSIKYLAGANAKSITYFETTGWRGVMETEAGSPVPHAFQSLPGSVFPMYQVLADIAEFRGGEVIRLNSDDPLRVDGLALALNGRLRLIIANYTAEPQEATFQLPITGEASVRRLDEHTAVAAMTDPKSYRAQPGEAIEVDGELLLELAPFGLATIDVATDDRRRMTEEGLRSSVFGQ